MKSLISMERGLFEHEENSSESLTSRTILLETGIILLIMDSFQGQNSTDFICSQINRQKLRNLKKDIVIITIDS